MALAAVKAEGEAGRPRDEHWVETAPQQIVSTHYKATTGAGPPSALVVFLGGARGVKHRLDRR